LHTAPGGHGVGVEFGPATMIGDAASVVENVEAASADVAKTHARAKFVMASADTNLLTTKSLLHRRERCFRC